MNPYLGTLWVVTILAKMAMLWLLWRRGMTRPYPMLAIYLGGSVAKALWLWFCYLQWGKAGYIAGWTKTQPVGDALYALITIEAVMIITAHFPKGKAFGAVTVIAFGLLAACALLAGAKLLPPVLEFIYEPALWLSSNMAAGCFITLALNIGFHKLVLVPWKSNVTRYASAVLMMLTLNVSGSVVTLIAKRDYATLMAGALLILGAPMVGCVIFARLNVDGERLGQRSEETGRAMGAGA